MIELASHKKVLDDDLIGLARVVRLAEMAHGRDIPHHPEAIAKHRPHRTCALHPTQEKPRRRRCREVVYRSKYGLFSMLKRPAPLLRSHPQWQCPRVRVTFKVLDRSLSLSGPLGRGHPSFPRTGSHASGVARSPLVGGVPIAIMSTAAQVISSRPVPARRERFESATPGSRTRPCAGPGACVRAPGPHEVVGGKIITDNRFDRVRPSIYNFRITILAR